jgi:hypothetical protein
MTINKFDESQASLARLADGIAKAKRPDYTIGSADVLANFKRVAERAGIQPMQAWLIYFLKHVDAISSYAGGNTNPSEPIDARFADAMNYLYLGYALIEEGKNAR